MIIKKSDDKSNQIQALEKLLNIAQGDKKTKIQKELNFLRAGIKGEQETTYHLDFNLRDSKNSIVIHDIRLELNGNVAQIDHLIIHKTLRIYCIETKHFNAGIKINDDGEFVQWNSYKKSYEGIPSPLAQSQRHISVLNNVFDSLIVLPEKLGFLLFPSFHSRVVVNNDARVERSKRFDSKDLVKSESVFESFKKDLDNLGFGDTLKSVSYEEIEDIAKQLIALHKPITINYKAKFGIEDNEELKYVAKPDESTKSNADSTKPKPVKPNASEQQCKKCKSKNVNIQYGKFGYFFKCTDCDGNTNIKLDCSIEGHKAKIRKDGNKFYLECAECNLSSLYFENK